MKRKAWEGQGYLECGNWFCFGLEKLVSNQFCWMKALEGQTNPSHNTRKGGFLEFVTHGSELRLFFDGFAEAVELSRGLFNGGFGLGV